MAEKDKPAWQIGLEDAISKAHKPTHSSPAMIIVIIALTIALVLSGARTPPQTITIVSGIEK